MIAKNIGARVIELSSQRSEEDLKMTTTVEKFTATIGDSSLKNFALQSIGRLAKK